MWPLGAPRRAKCVKQKRAFFMWNPSIKAVVTTPFLNTLLKAMKVLYCLCYACMYGGWMKVCKSTNVVLPILIENKTVTMNRLSDLIEHRSHRSYYDLSTDCLISLYIWYDMWVGVWVSVMRRVNHLINSMQGWCVNHHLTESIYFTVSTEWVCSTIQLILIKLVQFIKLCWLLAMFDSKHSNYVWHMRKKRLNGNNVSNLPVL